MNEPDTDTGYTQRLARLRDHVGTLERVAIAFSGGVDSSVLLHVARAALGSKALAVIADSASLARRELEMARATASAIGAELVELRTLEMDDARYRANVGDRCYFCKSALFGAMVPLARERGIRWLAFGEIADDLLDDRPGARAAREFGVVAPLADAGFTKADVRRYAHEHALAVWDKPSSPCLASRLPVGTRVTPERLARVERAEDALLALGLRVVRVRDHGDRARVEVGSGELAHARSLVHEIEAACADVGFSRVELVPYRSPAAATQVDVPLLPASVLSEAVERLP